MAEESSSANVPTGDDIPPDLLALSLGVEFSEKFFDRVFVKRLGWKKIPRSKIQGQRTADYAGEGYALELKNLQTNSFEDPTEAAAKRRLALIQFQMEEEKAGNLIADYVNGVAAAARGKRQIISERLWRGHVGNSIRNAIVEANGQIAATRLLRRNETFRGAVLIVNEALRLIDAISLAGLLGAFLAEPDHENPSLRHVANVDVAFGLCSMLERLKPENGGGIVHPLVCAGPGSGPSAEDVKLQDRLCRAIADEVSALTSKQSIHLTPPNGALEAPQRRQPVVLPQGPPLNIRVAGTEHPDAELDPGFAGIIARAWRRAKAGECNDKLSAYRFLRWWQIGGGKVNVEHMNTGLVIPEDTTRVAERFDRLLPQPADLGHQQSLARFLQIIESSTARVPPGPLFFRVPDEENPVIPKAVRQTLSLFSAVHLLRDPQILAFLLKEAAPALAGDPSHEQCEPHRGELWFRLLGGADAGFAVRGINLATVAEALAVNPWHVTHAQNHLQRFATGNILVELDSSHNVPVNPAGWRVHLAISPDRLLSINGVNALGAPLTEGPVLMLPNQTIQPWQPFGLTERILHLL